VSIVGIVHIRAASLALLAAAALPATAAAKTVHFRARHAGEAKLAVTANAPRADWGVTGHESAVLSVRLDGRYATSIVVFNGRRTLTYRVALGHVRAGRHRVTVRLDRAKSPDPRVRILRLRPYRAPRGNLVARYAPVLYGRNLPEIPGAYENSHTDVPLLAYHTSTVPDAAGNRTIEYTMIWSNEDEGTDTPALMARWGRTTDIEWIYRVTVDAAGRRIADEYQAADHATLPFDGLREGDHPLLETATGNNNTAAVTDRGRTTGYRFFLDTSWGLPPGRAREAAMDAHPWTYRVMAQEMIREHKVEPVASPDTPAMSDQRDYLYLEVKKATRYDAPPVPGSWAGVALAVQLKGDPRWYPSNHGIPDESIQRDDPAATTVELPPGTNPGTVAAIEAVAVPFGVPSDYAITVSSLRRGFFLSRTFVPRPSFVRWSGNVTLTPAQPAAVLWRAAPG
jgi:hypothetical protein